MQEPGLPADEAQRIKTLRELNLLDTPKEQRFDRLTRITQRLFDVPIVLISLVDSDRQWFKSTLGLEASETPRSISFCGHAVFEREIFIVNDTHLDHRFADNPLVVNAPHIRFYAGRPLQAANGQPLGTLCLIDDKPRQLDPADIRLLNDLSELVEKEINFPDLKTLNERLQRSEQELLDSLMRLRVKERLERSRSSTLELISRGNPLHEVLGSIAFEVEQHSPGLIACIELEDSARETAAFYWGSRAAQNDQPGVWCCRSAAITSSNGELLGRLTAVCPDANCPPREQLDFIEQSATLASIAIERDRSDRMIWKQANYDGLTGLPNRNLLRERLGQELNKARRHRERLGLMFVDLDHFKQINDSLGHHKGDELLAQVGARLNACMRDSDTVARLGGDEFTVVAADISCIDDIEKIATKILSELAGEFPLGAEAAYLTASIGIAFFPDHGEDMETLINKADRAMYDAKSSGGNRFVFCSE